MNSLEFINLEIATTKTHYKHHINFGQTNFAIADEKRLNHLLQIKSELETLNILQDKLEFAVIKVDTEQGTKYHIVMKGCNSLISEEEYEIVSNVLEVKE